MWVLITNSKKEVIGMKKIILLFIMMLSIFTVGYAFYDNIMTASLGLSVLDTRDTNPEGSKFVFGTYDGKDLS